MKRWIMLLAVLPCLALTTGCISTAAKTAFGEYVQFKTRYLEISGGAALWQSYQSCEFGQFTDGLNGRVPLGLMNNLRPLAGGQLAQGRLFSHVGSGGRGKTLLVQGTVVDYDPGSSEGMRVIGFGQDPFVTIRTQFIDKESGKLLAEVNLESMADSLRDWEVITAKGYGKAVENYLKSRGMQKLPEEKKAAKKAR